MGFYSNGYNSSGGGGSTNINPKGTYSEAVSYVVNDVVSYNGATYMCIADCTGVLPTDVNYWSILMENTYASRTADGIITKEDFIKLETIEGGAQVNQNAFSYVLNGTDRITASQTTDTLEVKGDTNVVITADTTNKKLTIGLSDQVETVTGSQAKINTHASNTDIHVTTDEKATWNAKSDFSGSYADLEDIPTSFTPSAHTHIMDDVENLVTTLAGKSDVGHTHICSDIECLEDALNSKASLDYVHWQEADPRPHITNISTLPTGDEVATLVTNTMNTYEVTDDIAIQAIYRLTTNGKYYTIKKTVTDEGLETETTTYSMIEVQGLNFNLAEKTSDDTIEVKYDSQTEKLYVSTSEITALVESAVATALANAGITSYEYTVTALQDNQTNFTIPTTEGYDETKNSVIVVQNGMTLVGDDDYSVVNGDIVLKNGVSAGTEIGLIVHELTFNN